MSSTPSSYLDNPPAKGKAADREIPRAYRTMSHETFLDDLMMAESHGGESQSSSSVVSSSFTDVLF
ncbi:4-hydroxyphenylacetate permease hpaX [Anopheles sinensis]|uniref:4-hydroxyphenylacetate permease hpaX n=1 Tax=Anopheles sinensis TaxID=74873 RepID=A0A084WUK9_ANOSI|nr:4-hydroxyphenylacetate permease hpaX [Anopheles sinensis]